MAGIDYGILIFNERKLLHDSGSDFTHKGMKFTIGKGSLVSIKIGKKTIGTDFINKSGFVKYDRLKEEVDAGYYEDKNVSAIEACIGSSTYTQMTISGDTYFIVGGYIYNNEILKDYFLKGIDEFKREKYYRDTIKIIKETLERV